MASNPPTMTGIPKLEPRKRRPPLANPTPAPETPPMPPRPDTSSPTWPFQQPTRRILSRVDHDLFLASPTYTLILSWVFSLSESVADTPKSALRDADISPAVHAILRILDEAQTFISRSPPSDQSGSRFGNKAFRGFLDLVRSKAPQWHQTLIHSHPDDTTINHTTIASPNKAADEISTYLLNSFGSASRIDYGSGHELNFIIWLLTLHQLHVLQRSDFPALVLRVFTRYLSLMRAIQTTYYLEPAGSHGVWGLDDYQFLPFLFGASQLLHHPHLTPRAIHHDLAIEDYADDFLYLDQVRFVNSTKTVRGLRWHSPMLDDISAAKSWAKIDAGMRRMFVAEVLGKLPVMQHFLFGSLIPAAEGMTLEENEPSSATDLDARHAGEEVGHAHDGTGWGDCCGIKVPSSIAATQEMKKGAYNEPLRRIPFD